MKLLIGLLVLAVGLLAAGIVLLVLQG